MPYRLNLSTLRWWIGMSGLVGFAQLFRTPVEVVIGIGYLCGTALLMVAYVSEAMRWAVLGFGQLCVSLVARALSAVLGSAGDWHGAVIVVAAWTMFARLAYERFNEARRVVEAT